MINGGDNVTENRVGIYVIRALFGNMEFSFASQVLNFFPSNYFVILYITLYIISPYLNRIFAEFTKKQWNKFIIIIIIMLLFSVWPTLVDLSEDILGKEWFGFSTIGAWGRQQSFNIVNFVLLYFVGLYLRYNDLPKWIDNRSKQILGRVLTVGTIFVGALISEKLTCLEMRSAWMYYNPLVILLAVLLFVLFRSFTFESKVVNELVKASFICFLFHGFLLPYMQIEKYSTGNVVIMIIHIVIVATMCYLISYVVYKVYEFFTRCFFVKLENIVKEKRIFSEN